jgi:hypothetical protein
MLSGAGRRVNGGSPVDNSAQKHPRRRLDRGRTSTYNVLHANVCYSMKTNVTLKLDADLLREVRIMAASEGTSISALLAERLAKMVRERRAYDGARRRALARMKEGFDLRWAPPRSRDELHER